MAYREPECDEFDKPQAHWKYLFETPSLTAADYSHNHGDDRPGLVFPFSDYIPEDETI